jgi:hypothetical protein
MPRPISNKIIYIGGLVDQQKEQQLNGQKEELEEVNLEGILVKKIFLRICRQKSQNEIK